MISEDYYTSAYIGIQRQVSQRLNFTVVAEDLRAWRSRRDTPTRLRRRSVRPEAFSLPQRATGACRRRSPISGIWAAHVYDAVQSGFAVSYAMPVHRAFKDGRQGGRTSISDSFFSGDATGDFL